MFFHNYSSDYFALGVIGYELMQGNRPFYTGNKNQYKDLILIYQPKIKSKQIKLCNKGYTKYKCPFFILNIAKELSKSYMQ